MTSEKDSSTEHTPESPFHAALCSPPSGTLMYQGAEARLYSTELYTSTVPRKCVVKERFVKAYRHPTLDHNLSLQRMRAEVRELLRCRKLGIDVPPVFQVDIPTRRIWLGLIGPGALTLHAWFAKLASNYGSPSSVERSLIVDRLYRLVSSLGRLLARLHANHVIHGDLTMANILVHQETEAETHGVSDPRLSLIDFGLSSTVSHSAIQRLPEEKAVDLYVFERALINAVDRSFLSLIATDCPQLASPENLMNCILNAYCEAYPSQPTQVRCDEGGQAPSSKDLQSEAQANIAKLDEVRLRGRKRLMIG